MIIFVKIGACSLITLLLVGTAVGAQAQVPRQKTPPPEMVFSQLILARLHAYSRGDSAAYRKLVAADFIHTDDHGIRRRLSVVLTNVAANRPADTTVSAVQYSLANVEVYQRPDLAMVEATVSEGIRFGTRRVGEQWQDSNVFVKRQGRWYFIRHAETPITGRDTNPTVGDSVQLRDFVGHYEWWPGYGDRITRRGATLYGQDTEKSPPWPFVQLGPETFFPKGNASAIMVFGRDKTGQVTHYTLWTPGWPLIRAKKVQQ